MQYKSDNITFRITARYHDGHFKYYLDCDQAEIYEAWFAIPSVESRKSAKRRAIEKIKRAVGGRGCMRSIVDLNTAEKELEHS